MAIVRGITLLDLIAALPPGLQGFIPAGLAKFIELLAIVDHQSYTSGRFYIHHGRVQSADEAGLQLPGGFPLLIPGLNRGVHFQFTHDRTPLAGGQNLEPAESLWILDLFLDRVGIPMPFMEPANRVDSGPAQVGHLVRDTTRNNVQLIGSGVLRIKGTASGPTIDLIAPPNPIAPTDPIGSVLEFNLAPKHMLLHDSGLGMTIDHVTWDDSSTYTPPEIEARNHDAAWKGLAINEASVYLPRDLPVFGDVSLGVRDLILGFDPPGFQGEAALELGHALLPGGSFEFFQDDGDGPVAATLSGTGRHRKVVLNIDTGSRARIYARLTDATPIQWKLPGSRTWVSGQQTDWFDIRPDSESAVLKLRERITQDGTTFNGPEHTFHFTRSDDPNVARPLPPQIRATVDSFEQNNVTSLSGGTAVLDGVSFTAIAAAPVPQEEKDRWIWLLEHGGRAHNGLGDTFTPQIDWQPGRYRLTLTDHVGQTRYLEIEIFDSTTAQLVAGSAAGVNAKDGTSLTISQLEGSYSLDSFHRAGLRIATDAAATLSGGVLTVPPGTLAEVALDLRNTNPGGEVVQPPPPRRTRHVRLLMEFDRTEPLALRRFPEVLEGAGDGDSWGHDEPYPYVDGDGRETANAAADTSLESWSSGSLAAWTASLPANTKFIVIGRCCDVGSESHNEALARDRAAQGRVLLLGMPLQAGTVTDLAVQSRGEQSVSSTGTPPNNNDFTPGTEAELAPRIDKEWRIKTVYGTKTQSFHGNDQAERKEYRGVDIFAVFPTPANQASTPDDHDGLAAGRRRALVPGADTPKSVVIPPREPELGFRLQVLAKWDSPTFIDSRDAIPTMVQLTLDWEKENLPVSTTPGSVVPQATAGNTPIIYQLIGRLSYDPRSGDTTISIAIDTPGDDRGLFDLVKASDSDDDSTAAKVFATALAIGPALLGGISPADPGGAAVRTGALLAACGFVVATDLISDGVATLQRFEIEQQLHSPSEGAGGKTKIVVDYTVSLSISNDFVQSADPIKVRYKNVGILIDNDLSGLDALEFIYEDTDFEIVDPGRWTMQGVLGDLLGVTEVRIGAGSVWFEVDLAFALDLGVVEVTKATVRLVIENGSVSVELRGLAANVDVPGVVKGGGQLKVGTTGELSAAIDLTIIPANISAWAALVHKKPMTQIAAGVTFATPIPLASSGLGIIGFLGRFVSNGTRQMAAIADPVERELAWYRADELDKYTPQAGQFALGLGAIVGTLPDAGFSFNAVGMLAIEFPDPSVVFAIDASFIAKPEIQPKEKGDVNNSAMKMLGIIAVDEDALVIGIRGSYGIPKLLDVQIPVGAYFPFGNGPGDAYVRIGCDGAGGRSGQPVTMTVLPGILDQKCWSYFMVEEKQLHNLGGDPNFNLDGFSLGFGAGWGFKWGGGPIYLRASAMLMIGIGTRPFALMGQAKVEGELRLIIVSISISGKVTIRIADNGSYLHGEFCGKVSFLFFDIEGCVEFTIDGNGNPPPPNPGPLVSKLSLADPYARITARGTSGVPGVDNTCWPDTCPVLRFDHRVGVDLAADSFQPTPSNGWPGNNWSGSTRLKYLYRLESVRLLKNGAPVGTEDWVSVWWLPTFRPGLPEANQPLSSEHEGWDLALLHWDLAPWSRNLPSGATEIPASPASTISQLCDPTAPPVRGCIFGEMMTRLQVDRVRLAPFQIGPPPFPSNFLYYAVEGLYPNSLESAVIQAINKGRQFTPGQVRLLPSPFEPAGESPMKFAYRLPYTSSAGMSFACLSIDGTFDHNISKPVAYLGLELLMPAPHTIHDRCITFGGFKINTKTPYNFTVEDVNFTDVGATATFVDVHPKGAVDGIAEVRFSAKGIKAVLPTLTDHVAVYVGLVKPPYNYDDNYIVQVYAYDKNGNYLASTSTNNTSGELTKLEISAKGIAHILVFRGSEQGYLQKICFWEATPNKPDYESIATSYFDALTDLPVVQGVFPDASTETWVGKKTDLLLKDNLAVLVLRYIPANKQGPYSGLRVLPYSAGPRVLMLSTCAYTQKAINDQANGEQTKSDLIDLIDESVNGPEEVRHRLLDADSEYTIEVGYSVAAWQPTDNNETNPPDVNTFDWNAGGSIHIFSNQTNSFKFRTAAAATLADEDILSPEVQSGFDPRSLARYLRGFDPATTQPSHFLADELRVFFDVEWIPTLLERYGRTLELRVQRTNPAPGSTQGLFHAIQVSPLVIEWGPMPGDMLPLSDQYIDLAIVEAPCLPSETPMQGSTGAVKGLLEPNVDYDFIAEALSINDPDDEIIIGRSHLHTSHYEDPAGLIDAIGFTEPHTNTSTPIDALLPGGATIPSTITLVSDSDLDAALTDLGLDPWPLPRQPRTCLLWMLVANQWRLAGVLLDSDESMVRARRPGDDAERMTLVRCQIHGTNLELTPRRSNVAGTRVLFAPTNSNNPLALPGGDLQLDLIFTDMGVTRTHSRSLSATPSLILKEIQS